MTSSFRHGREFSAKLRDLLQRSNALSAMTPEHWDALAESYGDVVYSEAMYRLARLEIPPEEARHKLLGILTHQRQLSGTLGRSVSLLTATCDYFTEVEPMMHEPVLVGVRLLQQKEEYALRDELTGLLNRRSFNLELPREMERFQRFGQCFTLLMLDLDHFKEFNDSYGHSAGDQALRDVAALLTQTARLYDRVMRYGGEEFAILLPQTDADEGGAVAERVRAAVSGHMVIYDGQALEPVTVSIGVACYPVDGLEMKSLVSNADGALYEAKALRNTVCRHHDPKRRHPRYILSDPLPLTLHDPRGGDFPADALDVSFGGLCCRSKTPVRPQTKVRLLLTDAARQVQLPLLAKVRRLSHDDDGTYHMGLSFRLDSLEDQMRLVSLLEGSHSHASTAAADGATAEPAGRPSTH